MPHTAYFLNVSRCFPGIKIRKSDCFIYIVNETYICVFASNKNIDFIKYIIDFSFVLNT